MYLGLPQQTSDKPVLNECFRVFNYNRFFTADKDSNVTLKKMNHAGLRYFVNLELFPISLPSSISSNYKGNSE